MHVLANNLTALINLLSQHFLFSLTWRIKDNSECALERFMNSYLSYQHGNCHLAAVLSLYRKIFRAVTITYIRQKSINQAKPLLFLMAEPDCWRDLADINDVAWNHLKRCFSYVICNLRATHIKLFGNLLQRLPHFQIRA